MLKEGCMVRVSAEAKDEPLIGRYANRQGRLSHLVAGQASKRRRLSVAGDSASGSDQDLMWVVAIARTPTERRQQRSNPYSSFQEYACNWVPVPARLLSTLEPASNSTSASLAPSLSPAAISAAAVSDVQPPVALIVCFRDLHAEQRRSEHLARFVPFMESFLCSAPGSPRFRIYIIEQSDDGRKFNRGKLLNIGFHLAVQEQFAGVCVFHDVDLLPSRHLLKHYSHMPAAGRPVHIARVWGRYNANPHYMGGVVAWNRADYESINGYPNNYWGWGGEDDEMMRRCTTRWGSTFKMVAPTSGTLQDLEEMDIKEKLDFLREHKDWKNYKKTELEKEHASTWQGNGISNLDYAVLKREAMADHTHRVTVDCKDNGPGHHDEWAGVDYIPDYARS